MFWKLIRPQSPRYIQIQGHEDEKDDIEPNSRRPTRPSIRLSGFQAIVTALGLVGFSFALGVLLASSLNTTSRAWKRLHIASPLADGITLLSQERELDGRLIGKEDNVFRQPPSPGVDAAWGNLSSHNFVSVAAHDLERIGKDPGTCLKIPSEYGYGPDAYVAAVDFGHKIHCLNRIRKEMHFDYYYKEYFPDGKPSALHQYHTDHCLYILLQSLMCDASTDISPFVWYDNLDVAFQDFVIHRKCGNFDGVFEWAEKHQFMEVPQDIEKPEGQGTVGPADEAFLALLYQNDE